MVRVAVIGTGYVGLVSGVCLAAKGHTVVCADINHEIVSCLNEGLPHIFERGLADLLKEVLAAGRFHATADVTEALSTSDLAIIAVGTPLKGGAIDLCSVRDASCDIGRYLKGVDRFFPIIVKSTVIPGTTDTVVRHDIEASSGRRLGDFGLGMNPEFLREGNAVDDFMQPDRIILGYEDDRTLALLEEVYAPWACEKLRVNTRTAELIKYANNVLLATQISAINEIANLAAALGNIDIMDVVSAIHLDKRWNPVLEQQRVSPEILTYLVPGCGFGGSCFPKDLHALRSQGMERGLPMHILGAILAVNDAQPGQVIEILEKEIADLHDQRCLVLGLAFKPGTDDTRESASVKIVQGLLKKGVRVVAHDPLAMENFERALGPDAEEVTFVGDWKKHLTTADIIVIATKWPEYESLVHTDLSGKIIFDARHMFAPRDFQSSKYLSIGRRIAPAAEFSAGSF
jgi:UDPglucose 6-dehydrogenase